MIIEKINGTMTDSLELTVASAVPARLTALVNAKNESTNNRPRNKPNITTSVEKWDSK